MVVLVTGSAGLLGRHLLPRLGRRQIDVRECDLKRSPLEDVCDAQSFSPLLEGVTGIVHLAAVSRVEWGERNPEICRKTNFGATAGLLRACLKLNPRPWVIYASSREVYGDAAQLPVQEDAPFNPLNVYARSKVAAEQACAEARAAGLLVNVCRFSNVYGCADDHPDRVAPAFALAAAVGGTIRIDGRANIFDFTHVTDVVSGLDALIAATLLGEALPPIQLVSGQGTTLGRLADLAAGGARKPVTLVDAPTRDYDVTRFVGDGKRARELLGWASTTSLELGMQDLIADMAKKSRHTLPEAALTR